MNKTLKIIIFICLAVIVIIVWFLLFPKKLNQHNVIFENKSFWIELAQTDAERRQGLMYREKLDEDSWMLFIFPAEWIHGFWMKNTLIPLDMVRINEIDWEYRVVDVKSAQPCDTPECEIYEPIWNAKYVLEINAWLTEKYWINIWDLVYIE